MKTLEELGISPAPWSNTVGTKKPFEANSVWDAQNGGVLTGGYAESVNDARLIAAAPELYECAIASLAEECDGCKFAMWDDSGNVRCRKSNKDKCPAQKLRDAIAKAGGMEV